MMLHILLVKDLAKGIISDKILRDRAYEIAKNRNYDGYQRALASMVYMFFDKKAGSGINVNEQLAKELHKPVIKKIKEKKYTRDLKTIFGQQIQLKQNHCLQRIKMFNIYYVSDVFTKYALVKPLKDKKSKTVLNAFIAIVNKSNHKKNQLGVD